MVAGTAALSIEAGVRAADARDDSRNGGLTVLPIPTASLWQLMLVMLAEAAALSTPAALLGRLMLGMLAGTAAIQTSATSLGRLMLVMPAAAVALPVQAGSRDACPNNSLSSGSWIGGTPDARDAYPRGGLIQMQAGSLGRPMLARAVALPMHKSLSLKPLAIKALVFFRFGFLVSHIQRLQPLLKNVPQTKLSN